MSFIAGWFPVIREQEAEDSARRRLNGCAGAPAAHPIALTGGPPAKRGRSTLRLSAERRIARGDVGRLSSRTVRPTLKKRAAPISEDDVVHSAPAFGRICLSHAGCAGGYHRPSDPKQPMVCLVDMVAPAPTARPPLPLETMNLL